MHICQDARDGGVVNFIKEDAVDGDVGLSIVGPIGVDADVVGEQGVGGFGVARVDVAERLDVGVAVQLGNAVNVVLIIWVAGCG